MRRAEEVPTAADGAKAEALAMAEAKMANFIMIYLFVVESGRRMIDGLNLEIMSCKS